MARILPLLLMCIPLVSCTGAGGTPRADGEARFDTAAGFRLGMLLPEARAAAAALGEELECRLVTPEVESAGTPDSLRQGMSQTQLCYPLGPRMYHLQFEQGSLRVIVVPMSEDWRFVPVDTVVSRLSRKYGEPVKRLTYATGSGRTEEAISWRPEGSGARVGVGMRCPTPSGAGVCSMEFHLLAPEVPTKGGE